jgi:hypothetical protein
VKNRYVLVGEKKDEYLFTIQMNGRLADEQRNAAACSYILSYPRFAADHAAHKWSSKMRKLLAVVTALSLFALSVPMQASAQATNPPAGKTEPAAKVTAKPETSTSTTSKHHAKRHHRHHRRHVAKHHRLHHAAAYRAHHKHVAAKKQHQVRHHRGHRQHVVRHS